MLVQPHSNINFLKIIMQKLKNYANDMSATLSSESRTQNYVSLLQNVGTWKYASLTDHHVDLRFVPYHPP